MRFVWPQEILDGQARRLELVVRVLGLPDNEIAARIGVSPQSWNHYTKGTRPFWGPALLEMRKMLPITLDWLYFGDESGMSVRVLETLYGRSKPVPPLRSADSQSERIAPTRARNR